MKNLGNFIPSTQNINLEILDLPECVNLTDRCKCSILNVDKCLGDKCTFKQTEEDKSKSYNRWKDLLNSSVEDNQSKIALKYYGGHRPWKE